VICVTLPGFVRIPGPGLQMRTPSGASRLRWRRTSVGPYVLSEITRTAQLGLLSSWVTTFQYVQAAKTDPIGVSDLAAVVATSEAEATGGNEVAVLSCALWRTEWAALTVARFEHDPSPASPARITTHLLQAAAAMHSTWSTAQSADGIDLGVDGQFTAVDAGLTHVAVDHTLAAVDGLDALLGPAEH
jgi:hypothetical protein